jgi:thiol:disulfide interchange protein DsbA
MKQLIILAALLFALSACSKEEQPQPAVEETVAVADEIAADEAAAAEEQAEAATETLEVVEESAAVEEETADEAIVLAVADTSAPAREWKYKEGQHYFRLVPTQPTVGGADKVEVSEIFMYSCPHCYTLDPALNEWAAGVDSGVRFVRIPAMFNRPAQTHAQLYYTSELLGKNDVLQNAEGFHTAVFEEFHRRGNRLLTVDSIQRLFARFGVSAEDFDKAWKSFPVNQKMNVGQDLVRRYNIQSVPAIVVNGKYRTSAADAGSIPELFNVIDELIEREGLR